MHPTTTRRHLLLAGLAMPFTLATRATQATQAHASSEEDATRALRAGGVVAVFRHARAPGVYDPPGMVLSDCSTQRNLDDEGRAQAQRLGAWFKARGLKPARVLSSPWCRCMDTARLGFGEADSWAALGSPSGRSSAERAAQLSSLQQALRAVPRGGFEVWVTHNFVIADLAAVSTASAEGLVLRGAAAVQVVATLPPP